MPRFRRVRAVSIGLVLALFVVSFSVDYTVKKGDTLGRIARDHDVTVDELVEANNIANPNLIYPGQVLIIPGEEGEPATIHIVKRDETLNKIAALYGVDAALIAKLNALDNPDLIHPGQELLIQDGSGSNEQTRSDDEVNGTVKTRSGRSHIVERGESLSSIAAQYKGVTAESIATANGIVDGRIYTGTRLFLDGPGYVAKGTEGDGTYTVKRGDRLVDIARRMGTTVAKLAGNNGIKNVNLIRSGQVLKVPAATTWICPVESPSFFNDWGFPRAKGARFHEGNDLFASFRAKVLAPVSGTVVFKTGSMGGNQFNLAGDDGVLYIGSHMDEVSGKSRKVAAGEILGYVGTSGNAQGTRPHLHFGMYWSGTVVNPYPSLVANGCK